MSKTIYCAQPFWHRERGLAPGLVHQFMTEERAVAGGQILAGGAAGVAVFSLTGDPDVDYWGEPVLIATIGVTPLEGGCSPGDVL